MHIYIYMCTLMICLSSSSPLPLKFPQMPSFIRGFDYMFTKHNIKKGLDSLGNTSPEGFN